MDSWDGSEKKDDSLVGTKVELLILLRSSMKDHIFQILFVCMLPRSPIPFAEIFFTLPLINNQNLIYLLKFSYKTCKTLNTKFDAQKIMYTLSLESPAINNITTLLFNVLLETQGIRLEIFANFRLRPFVSHPVFSRYTDTTSSSSLALLPSPRKERNSQTSFPFVRLAPSREREFLARDVAASSGLHFHRANTATSRGRRGNRREAPHDPRRRSIALRPTSERVCSDAERGRSSGFLPSRGALCSICTSFASDRVPLFFGTRTCGRRVASHTDLPRETRPDSFAIG